MKRSHAWVLVVFVLLVVVGLSTATFILVKHVHSINDQQDRLLAQQDRAITAARRAEYRICVRQMTTRAAALYSDGNHDEPRLPIYNCVPNLQGRTAIRLTPAQVRAFVHYVRTSKSVP